MTKPLIALMQPSSGLRVPNKGAAKAFYRPTLRGLDRIELEQGSSMLPRVFNYLWTDALNLRSQHPITHVAMLHDDVAPAEGWLDTLLDEMEATGADMISAVVPIKTSHGLTSTAVNSQADPWVSRRLCLREVFNLPETFGVHDVPWREPGACLLPNTGCWICRFDQPWVERVAFRFHNRIVKAPDGKWTAHDIAEDWDFGRQLAAFGCKALATRKVQLEHELPQWHNRHAWGDWPTDLAFLEYTRRWNAAAQEVTTGEPRGWVFPADVDGWLTEAEGRVLAELARDKRALEIGSYCGRSTICLAQTAQAVCVVDPFDGRASATPRRDTLVQFMENVSRYGVLDKITVRQGLSGMIVPDLQERFDVAFIDGAHDRESVLADAQVATGRLAPDGLLVFHDYGPSDPGVIAAVDSLVASGARFLALTETVAVLRPAA